MVGSTQQDQLDEGRASGNFPVVLGMPGTFSKQQSDAGYHCQQQIQSWRPLRTGKQKGAQIHSCTHLMQRPDHHRKQYQPIRPLADAPQSRR